VFNKNVRDSFGEGVRGTKKVEGVCGTRKVEKHCTIVSYVNLFWLSLCLGQSLSIKIPEAKTQKNVAENLVSWGGFSATPVQLFYDSLGHPFTFTNLTDINN
jgi:hypothetical protein